MEKIQFKRANTTAEIPTLDTGEIGIVQSRAQKDNYIVIGTDYGNKSITAYPYYSGSTDGVVYDVTIQDSDVGTEKNLVVKKVTLNGSKTETPISFTISGTIEKAKQLVNDSGTAYSVGGNTSNKCQPIFFTGGKPSAITQTRGANNTPIWMDGGVIKSISGNIGNTNRPVYIDSNGAISPITQSTGSAKLQYFSNGTIVTNNGKIGGKKKPIYYDGATGNGFSAVDNFDDDGNYTGTTVKSKYINLDNLIPPSESKTITLNGTVGVSLGAYINSEGLYMVVIQYNGDYYTYMIFSQRTGVWHSSTAYIKYGTGYIPTSISQKSNWNFYWESHSGSLATDTGTIVQIKKIG